MNKKVIISLVLIAVMAFGAGLGTFAWFTSQATSGDNVFATGTLKIDVNKSSENDGKFNVLSFNNMAPGDGTQLRRLVIANTGSLNLAMFKQFKMSGSEGLAKNLIVKEFTVGGHDYLANDNAIWKARGGELNNNKYVSLYDLTNWDTEISEDGWEVYGLKPGESQIITLQFELDENAGNGIQGKSANLTMSVKATQMKAGAMRSLNLNLKTPDFGDMEENIEKWWLEDYWAN